VSTAPADPAPIPIEEQLLEGLGLDPIDGRATCPACDKPTFDIPRLRCPSCTSVKVAAAIVENGNLSTSPGLTVLANALAARIHARRWQTPAERARTLGNCTRCTDPALSWSDGFDAYREA
jgi:hypothetical protein